MTQYDVVIWMVQSYLSLGIRIGSPSAPSQQIQVYSTSKISPNMEYGEWSTGKWDREGQYQNYR